MLRMKRNTVLPIILSACILACSGCETAQRENNFHTFKGFANAINTIETADEALEEGEILIDLDALPEITSDAVSSSAESKPQSDVSSQTKSETASSDISESEISSSDAVSSDELTEQDLIEDETNTTELGIGVDENGEPSYRKKLIENRDTSATAPLNIHTGSPVDMAWFDDCVFLGDGFTNGLSIYNDTFGELGNAKFVSAACIGWVSSQYDWYHPDAFHPIYNGQQIFMYDAPAVTEANKVVITLGMNDVCGFSVQSTLDAADSFIQKIRYLRPGAKIYLT